MRFQLSRRLCNKNFVLGLMLVAIGGYASADSTVYKCLQPDGHVHFSDVELPGCKTLALPSYIPASHAPNPAKTTADRATTAKQLTVAQAKDILEHDLRDPEATHYKDVFVSKTGDVCGRMNAKNSFGGYVGYVDFLVRATGGAALTLTDTEKWTFVKAWEDHCKRK